MKCLACFSREIEALFSKQLKQAAQQSSVAAPEGKTSDEVRGQTADGDQIPEEGDDAASAKG